MANLVAGIDARRTIALDRFLFGLGIRDIGEQTSLVLARAWETWDALKAACLAAAKGVPSEAWTRLSETHAISPRVLTLMAEARPPAEDPWPDAPMDQKIALAFPGLAAPARRSLAELASDWPGRRRMGPGGAGAKVPPTSSTRSRASPASAPSPHANWPASSTSRTTWP